MRWVQFKEEQPRLAEVGEARLIAPGVVLVGTTRVDGTPRISPVEPLVWEGDLWLSMMLGSHKAADLQRDPRVLVHGIVTNRDGADGEFKVRGEAVEVPPGPVQEGYAAEVSARLGWEAVPGWFHLFRVDLADVAFVRYDVATGDQFTTRWPTGGEFVRRHTTPTSVGEPEPYEELLVGSA